MFDKTLNDWLLKRNGDEVVQIVRALLIAEANRLHLPGGAVDSPANSNMPDGGVDARTDVPKGADTLLPIGRWSWQIKSGKQRPKLDLELEKPQVKADLADGRGYVLAWIHEPSKSRAELDAWLRTTVDAHHGAKTPARLLLCIDVERLLQKHPTVAQVHGGPPILALTLNDWARSLRLLDFPLQNDEARSPLMERIAAFCVSTDGRHTHLRVFGDSGVGKSRLVYEALSRAGLAAQAAVALSPPDLNLDSLRALVKSQTSRAIVVCDDCDDASAVTLEQTISAAGGRLRLITIGDRPRRSSLPGPTEIEVMPLASTAVANLVQQVVGLQQEDAELVARMSEGYPKLAVELAHAIPDGGERSTVITLLRSRRVERLLDKMLPDEETRRMLGHLAIVERIGFTEAFAGDTDELCKTFHLDPYAFRRVVEIETGRFVAEVGRVRRITPRALAASLLINLINQDVAGYAANIVALPDRLFDAFREQVQLLGGDPGVDALIREIATRRADSFRSPEQLTVDGARLLNAVAFALPEVGADLLQALLAGRSRDELLSIDGARRRDIVLALEHLLWFRSTFEVAADCLLSLAVAETEPYYANNATGVLVGAFQLMLGGTEVPIHERLGWLETAAMRYGEASALIAAKAMAATLAPFQIRTRGWRGARLQPIEWRPSTQSDIVDAYLRAWRVLRELASANHEIEKIAREVAGSVFVVARSAELFDQVMTDLPTMSWSFESRGELVSAARLAVTRGDVQPGQRAALETLARDLSGDSDETKLDVLVRTPFGKLADATDRSMIPKALTEAASSVLAQTEIANRLRKAQDGDWLTQFHLFRKVGLEDEDLVLASAVLSADSRDAARIGYVSGRGARNPEWADQLLKEWLEEPGRGAEIPAAVGRLEPSNSRAELAVASVAKRLAPPSALSELSMGSWTRDLGLAAIDALLRTISADNSELAVRSALRMIDAWLDGHPGSGASLMSVASMMPILREAVTSHDASLTYSCWHTIDRLGIAFDERLSLALLSLTKKEPLWKSELEAWKRLAREDGPRTARRLVNAIVEDREGWSIVIQGSRLLSLVRAEAGTETVWSAILETDPGPQIRLLSHIDFTQDELDPIVVRWFEQAPSPALNREVSNRFAYPHEVVTGSYAAYLQRRLEVLARWRDEHPSAAVRLWATRVVPDFERWVSRVARDEAEER